MKAAPPELIEAYRASECTVLIGDIWQDLGHRRGLVITAWNPGSRHLPLHVNEARDAVLKAELDALALETVRAKGRSGDWYEMGWLIEHQPARSLHLLRRYGQLAGFVFSAEGRALLWSDGRSVPL